MSKRAPEEIETLVAAVHKSSKYRHVCREIIAAIGAHELEIRHSTKRAIKATKAKLHQIGGAYLSRHMPYNDWERELEETIRQHGPRSPDTRRLCRQILARHASTRERLGILDTFFAETLASIAPVHSVIDLACGLNPLATPWMPLADNALYVAYDIYDDLMGFVGRALPLFGLRAEVETRDVLHRPPERQAELALLLKSVPCLEQLRKDAGHHLLRAIPARHLLVSFPARSLGGHDKNMVEQYETHFWNLVAGEDWHIERHAYDGELAFLIGKP